MFRSAEHARLLAGGCSLAYISARQSSQQRAVYTLPRTAGSDTALPPMACSKRTTACGPPIFMLRHEFLAVMLGVRRPTS